MSETELQAGRVLRALVATVIIAFFLLFFTLLRPRPPKVVATVLHLRRLDYHITPTPSLKATLGLAISVNNPNYAPFKYRATTALTRYRDELVATTPIAAGSIPARSVKEILTIVEVAIVAVAAQREFLLDLASGELNFTSVAVAEGTANVIVLRIRARTITFCEVTMFLTESSSVSECISRVEI